MILEARHAIHIATSYAYIQTTIYRIKEERTPSRYLRTIWLIIWPLSSSTRYFWSFSARKPSCPCAMYSRVMIRYLRPSRERGTDSPSTRMTGVEAPLLVLCVDWRLVFEAVADDNGVGDALVLVALAGSCTSQTPRTRCPGARRESQDTRNPEMTGNRLCTSVMHSLWWCICAVTHPSCAGHVDRLCSKASQRDAPSISSATIGSSNGSISMISPSVMLPTDQVSAVGCGVLSAKYQGRMLSHHAMCPRR